MGWNPSIGIPLIIAGLIVLALIYFFGRPRKPGQGRRKLFARDASQRDGERQEPTIGELPQQGELDVVDLGEPFTAEGAREPEPQTAAERPQHPPAGARAAQPIDRIVTLFVSARPNET